MSEKRSAASMQTGSHLAERLMSEERPDTTPHRLLAVPALYPTKQHADSKSHGCKRLEGKHAIVSASTRGIGFSIAQRLAEEGAQVCMAAAHGAGSPLGR